MPVENKFAETGPRITSEGIREVGDQTTIETKAPHEEVRVTPEAADPFAELNRLDQGLDALLKESQEDLESGEGLLDPQGFVEKLARLHNDRQRLIASVQNGNEDERSI
jgi:hypothetical protein